MDTADPQQWNAYSYSNNSPITFSDPTGLWCDMCNDGNGWLTERGDDDNASQTPAPSPTQEWTVERIPEEYQVSKDPREIFTAFGVDLVVAEWDVLIEQFYDTATTVEEFKKLAESGSEERYPGESISGGRRDAFRHTYWSMLIAHEYGQKFAFDLTTAHERNPIGKDWQEAMDLYNNEQGRLAARAFENHPSFFESAAPEYVQFLVETGQVLAVQQDFNHQEQQGENFRLVPSNQVPRGYQYEMREEPWGRSGVDPGRLPCSTMAGGQRADR